MNLVPEIRLAQPRDTRHISDLDVKCFDFSWTEEEWKLLDEESTFILVACVYGTPVGMLVCDLQEFKGRELLHIYKVCVGKKFRGKNIGKRLLAHAYEMAIGVDADALAISVPESMTRKNSPTDCSGWLAKMHFKAVCILEDKVWLYGQEEDVIMFVFSIT